MNSSNKDTIMLATIQKKKFTLQSAEMVSAPGILKWAINGYHFERDRQAIIEVMRSWDVDVDILHHLLSGEIEWHEENGNVVFEA